MTLPKGSHPESVLSAFHQLSEVASDLNSVSDELGKAVTDIDGTLKTLGLGVSAWVPFRDGSDDFSHDHWSDDIGYAKINGKWGIAIRTVEGNLNDPEYDKVESWLFNDAPRDLRLAAIGSIAPLLEHLTKVAKETTSRIKKKLPEAQEVASTLKIAAASRKTGGAR